MIHIKYMLGPRAENRRKSFLGTRHYHMRQGIIGYHRDEEAHWVAELSCGHNQHVRHDPPWIVRDWVTTPEGRHSMLGYQLDCKKCDQHEPRDNP